MAGPTRWETYQGGDEWAEHRLFAQLAEQVMRVQSKNRRFRARREADPPVTHAFHEKTTFAVHNATLALDRDLPGDLRPLPGEVIVRFSNAAGTPGPDGDRDLRGMSLRIPVRDHQGQERQIDWLLTNYPVSHARDATQFVRFAVATAGGRVSRLIGMLGLPFRVGPFQTARMVVNLLISRRRIDSVATEAYYSRGALLWGADGPVQLSLRPVWRPSTVPIDRSDPDYLFSEAESRLAAGAITFQVMIHRFVDPRTTPVENTAVRWKVTMQDQVEPIGTLTIHPFPPEQEWFGHASDPVVSRTDFNPFNTTEDLRPLGNLNRARKAAYDASAAHRHGYRFLREAPPHNLLFGALSRAVFGALNRRVPWYRFPTSIALLNLQALRRTMFRHNLIETAPDAPPSTRQAPAPPPESARIARTADGTFNDLSAPYIGAFEAPFGRNMPVVEKGKQHVDTPNPIDVSNRLLERTEFIPATSLNLLAAAWIQFQVHDWIGHERAPLGSLDIVIPVPPGQPAWRNTRRRPLSSQMRIAADHPATGVRADPNVLRNTATFWWDASELYGSSLERQLALRDGGAGLLLGPGDFLPNFRRGDVSTGFNDGWWLGLGLMHSIFAREHNVICGRLAAEYPRWTVERVFQTARLIVSALMAKIHTLEWTPAALANPAMAIGMKANWAGPPADERLTRFFTWLIDTPALKGIPQTFPYHYRTPYALTEEFSTVYRMHPLIPDDYTILDHRTGRPRRSLTFSEISGAWSDDVLVDVGLDDSVYSFAVAHPGAITLHNFPKALRRHVRENHEIIDLAVVDLVRARSRGVPRYNQFRAALRMPRIRTFEDLSTGSAEQLRAVYKDIDAVDTMIGMFAETPPKGFAFSDTAFRIFIMTATRRIQSDRFLTVDFRPGVYSEFGMDWIARTDMASIIGRHCPSLASVLPRDGKVFAPWRPVGAW